MGNVKAARDMLRDIEDQLREAGVEWETHQTRRGHWQVKFYCGGKLFTVGFSGSEEPRAAQNTHSRIKRILEGTLPCVSTKKTTPTKAGYPDSYGGTQTTR